MRFKQIVIKREDCLVPVRLGKPLDPRIAGREAVIVVRIEKLDAYEVVTIHRISGSAKRYSFGDDQVHSIELDAHP